MASSTAFNSMKWSLYPSDSFEHFTYEVPWWARTVLLFDFVIFLPILLVLRYTLPHVYPVFAIIEDKGLEKGPIGDDSPELNAVDNDSLLASPSAGNHGQTDTSSPSAIYRLLVKDGGILANCRGLACALLQTIPTTLYIAYHARFLRNEFHMVARLLFSLLLVQFSTMWLHLVIAQKTDRPFESRIPPFKRTFRATWLPTMLHWAAVEFTGLFPSMIASSMNIDWPSFALFVPDNTYSFRLDMAAGDAVFYYKCAAVIFATVVGSIFLVVPSQVVLMRIQASLLPVEDSTIVPFDRSFGGRIQPDSENGRDYATISDAWHSFSRAHWRGLITLSFKIIILSLSLILLMCVVVGLQWAMIVTQDMEPNEYL
ncbi:hypothetical protein TGAM01_v208857 [Trichoderma gamsii]|uniref:Ubiquitin carrier protein n=1 Tax=Trichoderma gamsii TaxID=398673 RepID=A0A2P4ZDL9_9HYPO|nr:hypothetical protein TGAM01_v208857 [Trichoderma gamsii]PON22374.1 hypothetical protein TGAM01_v208857 [Trichoderma gamsii]